MNDRSRAIDVLQRARDLLAERLTERILESRDEILADALGMSYQSEIDAVYEQIGVRLNHVSAMLGNLPPEIDPPDEPPAAESSADEPAADIIALPAPRPIAGYLLGREPVSFRTFGLQIQTGNLGAAGASLAALFDLTPERGEQCAEHFFARLRENPAVMGRAQALRQELASGNFNQSLSLLWECFGLQGIESIAAIQTLRTHLATVAPSE
jgi:hypothetical protein